MQEQLAQYERVEHSTLNNAASKSATSNSATLIECNIKTCNIKGTIKSPYMFVFKKNDILKISHS